MKRFIIFCLFAFVATLWATTSHAVQVGIDSFSIASSTLNFTDNFSDGAPPPCGPLGCGPQPTFYGVNSTNPLPAESAGFLQLDSANGILSTNAGGGARITETVQKAGTLSQLDKITAGAISMTGVFTLPTLSGPLNEGYGIRFIDTFPNLPGTNQQVLELNVQWWTGNASNPAGWYIRYQVQDFNLDTITPIDADLVSIPSGDNEICLSLNRSAGSNDFAASYAYGTNGACSGTAASLGSAAGFAYQDFVRGQFQAFDTVPEPGTWLLLGVGLVGLVAACRRWKA